MRGLRPGAKRLVELTQRPFAVVALRVDAAIAPRSSGRRRRCDKRATAVTCNPPLSRPRVLTWVGPNSTVITAFRAGDE